MENIQILVIITVFALIVHITSVFYVIRYAKEHHLPLKRWIFYAFYFGIFAVLYLILKKPKMSREET